MTKTINRFQGPFYAVDDGGDMREIYVPDGVAVDYSALHLDTETAAIEAISEYEDRIKNLRNDFLNDE